MENTNRKHNIFIMVSAAIFLFSMAGTASATWWNTSWAYSMSNGNANGTYVYGVYLSNDVGTSNRTHLFFNGHAQPDFRDVRFVQNNNVLPHWIENTTSGLTWVNVSGNAAVTVYYGNSGATAVSNISTTADIFGDDFSTATGFRAKESINPILRRNGEYVFYDSNFDGANLTNWVMTGNAWDINLNNWQCGSSYGSPNGGSYACARRGSSETATGNITSGTFTIAQNTINFYIMGWDGATQNNPAKNYVQLVNASDGTVLMKTTPPLSDGWSSRSWNTSAYIGYNVYIQGVDSNSAANYAWFAIDGFVGLDDTNMFFNSNFNAGNLTTWTATGNAWYSAVSASGCGNAGLSTEGWNFACSKPGGESLVGNLTSPNFTIDANSQYIKFYMKGWDGSPANNPAKNYVQLVRANDSVILAVTNAPQNDGWVAKNWDVSSMVGDTVYIQLVDSNNAGGYAWIAADGFSFLENGDSWENREFAVMHNETGYPVKGSDGLYWGYYSGGNNTYQAVYQQIFLAKSSDLINWTKIGKVLGFGAAGQWDSKQAACPDPTYVNGTLWLAYCGKNDAGGSSGMGIAYSTDGITFTKSSNNPILTPLPGAYPSIWGGAMIRVNSTGKWRLWYDRAWYDVGTGHAGEEIAYTDTTNATPDIKFTNNQTIWRPTDEGCGQNYDREVGQPSVFIFNNLHYIFEHVSCTAIGPIYTNFLTTADGTTSITKYNYQLIPVGSGGSYDSGQRHFPSAYILNADTANDQLGIYFSGATTASDDNSQWETGLYYWVNFPNEPIAHPQGWLAGNSTGSWTVRNGQLYRNDTGSGQSVLTVNSTTVKNVSIRARYQQTADIGSPFSSGVFIRGTGLSGGTGYEFSMDRVNEMIKELTGLTTSGSTAKATTMNTWTIIEADAFGSTLTMIQDGTTATATDNTFTSGSLGIRQSGSLGYFDYFFARNYTSPEPLLDTWGTEQVYTVATYIPPAPTSVSSTTGNFWVNTTWAPGAGNITDGYNVSVNGAWANTTNTYHNSTLTAHAWHNVTVWGYNSTGGSTLSLTSVESDTRVPNNAPVQGTIGNQAVIENSLLTFTIATTDADLDTITYGTNATKGTLVNNVYTWTPTHAEVGVYRWYFSSSDGYGGAANETITVTVTEEPTYSISGYVFDNNNAVLSGTTVQNGSNTSTTNTQGYYSITAMYNGSYNLTFSKTNFESKYLIVTVNGANLVNQNKTIYNNGTPAQVTGLGNGTVTNISINLTWSANAETDLWGYEVFRNETHISNTTRNYYVDTGLNDNQTYGYQVRANDTYNNWGSNSSFYNMTTGGNQTDYTTPTPTPTPTPAQGGSGGGGGGGGGGGSQADNNTLSFERKDIFINNGITTTVNYNTNPTVTSLTLYGLRNYGESSALVKILKGNPTNKTLDNIYKYFSISIGTMKEQEELLNFIVVNLTIKIPKTNVSDNVVEVYRYHNNIWELVKLEQINTNTTDNYNYYKLTPPGLSDFAVVIKPPIIPIKAASVDIISTSLFDNFMVLVNGLGNGIDSILPTAEGASAGNGSDKRGMTDRDVNFMLIGGAVFGAFMIIVGAAIKRVPADILIWGVLLLLFSIWRLGIIL